MLNPSRTLYVLIALVALAALVLTACGGNATAPTSAPTTSAAKTSAPATAAGGNTSASPTGAATSASVAKGMKFYFVTPAPIGVNAFLILGKKGIEDAAKKYSATAKTLESENDPSSREQNVRAAISDGANLVMVLGFEFNDIIPKVAAESPKVQFLIVDQCIDKPAANVRCAVSREYEAAYLLGAEAGYLTKSNKVGAISAIDIPFLHRYTDSFTMGAKAVNPAVASSTLWIGTDPSAFSDPARAKEQALAMSAGGADQIFAAGAASNLGIFEAAKDKNFFTYGVDVNQCPLAPGHVVDNLLKRVDVEAVKAIDSIFSGGKDQVLVFGLQEGGIGIVPFALDNPDQSQCEIMKHPDVIAKLKDLQDKIIKGDLKIKDPMTP